MYKERLQNKWAMYEKWIGAARNTWWRKTQGVARVGAACVSLALAACGGSPGSDVAPISKAAESDVAAAASAAVSNTVPLAAALKMNTSGLDAAASNDRFIIKYKTGTTEGNSASAVQPKLDRLASALPSKAHRQRRIGLGADLVTTDRKLTGKEARAFMRAIATDPNVEYVEPDLKMTAQMVPNDPDYSKQWGLSSNLIPGNTAAGIRAEAAWDVADGTGVVIALVDGGVTDHSDLNANILPGYDFTGYGRGGNGTDPGITQETGCKVDWHGTHIAGIIGAQINNGNGIAGVAPGAKIVPVRVLNACGTGNLSDVADGIVWAAGGRLVGVPTNAYPARVINLSLGSATSCTATMQSAINYAVDRGAIVVAAAGNNRTNVGYFTPANCFNVVNVAATTSWNGRWIGSNFGDAVDIAAPGDSIWSTLNNGAAKPGTEGYAYRSGTSMAAPAVSGVMALVQSASPIPLSYGEMRTLLQQNAQPFPNGQPDQPIGPGILDASAAVTAAKSGKIPAAANFECKESTQVMLVTCTDLSTARGAPIVSWAWNLGFGEPDMLRTQSVNPYFNYEYPGFYQITLKVTDAKGAVSTHKRLFQVLAPTASELEFGASPSRLDVDSGSVTYFSVVVPPGSKSIRFNLKPGSSSDIATMYVRADSPTMLKPVCSSVMVRGTPATCTVTNPSAGTYYAIASATTALTNASVQATLN